MFRKILGFSLVATFVATAVSAQEFSQRKPVYTFRAMIDQDDELIEGPTGALVAKLVTRMTAEAKARFEWRDGTGKQLFVEPFIRIRHYPRAEDEQNLGIFGEFRYPMAHNDKMQLRWRGGIEQKQDIYERVTLQVALNTRHSKSHTSRANLRYRYRDQDEAKTFDGYDQHEMFVSFQQAWMPAKGGINRISGMVYADVRHADAEQYDYTEIGARLKVRFYSHKDWAWTAFAKGFVREYVGNFSTDYDFARRDKRLTVDLEARYDLGQLRSLVGAVGWEENRSNVETRSFSGAVLRLEYTMQFN